jgi:hypothetical protein
VWHGQVVDLKGLYFTDIGGECFEFAKKVPWSLGIGALGFRDRGQARGGEVWWLCGLGEHRVCLSVMCCAVLLGRALASVQVELGMERPAQRFPCLSVCPVLPCATLFLGFCRVMPSSRVA